MPPFLWCKNTLGLAVHGHRVIENTIGHRQRDGLTTARVKIM